MGRFRQFRYWVLGMVTLILCVGSHPAIASVSGFAATFQSPHVAQAIANPEQQAQVAYDEGRYAEAAELLEQAHQQYQAQGNGVKAAIALSNLSLTYQKLGQWPEANTALDQAWKLLDNQAVSLGVKAQILDVQGQLQFAQGQLIPAVETWQQTADFYAQLDNIPRHALSRLHQVQALQARGLFQQVLRNLRELSTLMADQPDSATKAAILRQLGDSLRATGNLPEAKEALKDSQAVATRLQNNALMAATNLSLGNLEYSQFRAAVERATNKEDEAVAMGHANQAIGYYTAVTQGIGGSSYQVQAGLNLMRLLTQPAIANKDAAIRQEAARLYREIATLLDRQPLGRATLYGYTGLAESLIALKDMSDRPSWAAIVSLLEKANRQAAALGDARARSSVLGTLGHVYEQTREWSTAEDFSRQALSLSQRARADDLSYRWQWQLGRILKSADQPEEAIASYTGAFKTLKSIRSDLITANPDVRFSFRESVEPIYRELVALLLSPVAYSQNTNALAAANRDSEQNRLRLARTVMEALQLAELENFFQAACIEETLDVDEVVSDTNTAVIYTMLLDDSLEVVLTLPQQADQAEPDLVHYTAPASRQDIDQTLLSFKEALNNGDGQKVRDYGNTLYNWLLKSAVDDGQISPTTIKTLVFVLDGDLRSIPMATLYDGEKYLIETYALSLILGLEVRDPLTLPNPEQLQVLAASLTNPPASEIPLYGPLPKVNVELDQIAATRMQATLLRDEEFTQAALEQQLNETDYTIVHLATHGEFGRDRQNTFILDSEGRINIDTLGNIFSSRRQAETRLEMLILSACKTATGDSQEVLGIAGAAVQAGARSTIATLWSVDDEASVRFTEKLYTQLGQSGISRAEALRQAQQALMAEYPGRPRYWAPYVLVGSWR
ncbi:MAG: CHAT domain-containing protein [Cyanobacteria bacterium J06559_3]